MSYALPVPVNQWVSEHAFSRRIWQELARLPPEWSGRACAEKGRVVLQKGQRVVRLTLTPQWPMEQPVLGACGQGSKLKLPEWRPATRLSAFADAVLAAVDNEDPW